MNVSINGTSKEVVQFLLSLSGQIATALGKPAPVVTEVHGMTAAEASATHPEQVKNRCAGAGTVAFNGTVVKTEAGDPISVEQVVEPVAPEEVVAHVTPPPAKTDEPKTRKRHTKAEETKLEPVTGDGSQTAEATQTTPPAQESTPTGVTLPTEWPLMTVPARRHWAQTTEGLTPSERFELLQANPLAADPLPSDGKPETKAETKTPAETKPETKPGAAPAADVECVLPPTWSAWSLPKKIMWATMRSAGETNSLLKQLGFAGKIPDATEETLAQVRRKLEIAMRMEAQA